MTCTNAIAHRIAVIGGLLAIALCCSVAPSRAGDMNSQPERTYTLQTYIDWMNKYANTKPGFKPGDVLTSADMEKLRPFVPPGYMERLNFPEFKAEIVAPYDNRPSQAFIDCTEKYGQQVTLTPDGALIKFRCGQPFPNSSISKSDPNAGIKAAWNFEYRWQNYGFYEAEHLWAWVRPGGAHQGRIPKNAEFSADDPFAGLIKKDDMPTNIDKDWGGGGTFERTLSGWYKRTYFSHLAQLDGGSLPIPGAQNIEFKEWTNFSEPYDVRGTTFIVYRYVDPYRPDDGWAYLPALRRVRRISTEIKSDSLLGTDLTIEDFYGFAGRELDWNWKYLGEKDVLNIYNPHRDFAVTYGDGLVPDDVWELRREYVVLRTPKDSRHPYGAVLDFFDPQTWSCYMEIVFDKSGKLWKVIPWQWQYTETRKHFVDLNKGAYAMAWQFLSVWDVQNNRGTTIRAYGAGMPDFPVPALNKLYDVNRLEQVHR
jgi:hypothetical protein